LRADKTLAESRELERSREKEFGKTKEHLERREQTLDKRQGDLDRDYENMKQKIEEVRTIKEKAEEALRMRTEVLEKIAGMTCDEAAQLLVNEIEINSATDLQSRIQKLEMFGEEQLRERAKVIQRLQSID
jgi:ribonuclease Y